MRGEQYDKFFLVGMTFPVEFQTNVYILKSGSEDLRIFNDYENVYTNFLANFFLRIFFHDCSRKLKIA